MSLEAQNRARIAELERTVQHLLVSFVELENANRATSEQVATILRLSRYAEDLEHTLGITSAAPGLDATGGQGDNLTDDRTRNREDENTDE